MPSQSTTLSTRTLDDSAAVPLATAGQVGDWELVSIHAEGRWSRVYQAAPAGCSHGRLDYLLKTVHPESADDPVAHDMLWRDATVGQSVLHPNLVAVLASNFDVSPAYVVMPHLPGTTLADALRCAGRLAVPHALWIARQVAQALTALHAAGWLHSDIKPENIVVGSNGHVTLIDLGMAQQFAELVAPRRVFRGTPRYCAPEWLSAENTVGEAADVYSLGQVLVDAVWGVADSSGGRVERSSDDRVSFDSSVPATVSQLIHRMLSTDPLARPTAAELVERLLVLEIETFALRNFDCRHRFIIPACRTEFRSSSAD